LFGPGAGSSLGFFLGRPDQNYRSMGFCGAVARDPGDPVRAPRLGVDFEGSGYARHVFQILHCALTSPLHRISVSVLFSPPRVKESYVTLTCPNCGNDRNFLVKTLQMHVVNVEGGRVEVSEESRPAVLEVLCDECESALNFEEFEDTLRKEVLLTIGAR
jgi:hypothetical protein